MTKLLKTLLLAAVAVATPAVARQHDDPDTQLAKLLAGRVAGKPTSCIPFTAITSSQIIPGRAIVYRVGARLYVNTPQSGADTLRDDDILVTRSFGAQLCRIDSVRLVDRASRFPRGFVVLGDFVPYAKPRV